MSDLDNDKQNITTDALAEGKPVVDSVNEVPVDTTEAVIEEIKEEIPATLDQRNIVYKPNVNIFIDHGKYPPYLPSKVAGQFPPSSDEINCTTTNYIVLSNNSAADMEGLDKLSGKGAADQTISVEDKHWLFDTMRSAEFFTIDDRFTSSAKKAGSEWRQTLLGNEGNSIRGGVHRLESPQPTMSGASAVLAVRAALGMGTQITKPLYNSGIWCSFKALSEAEICEADRQINYYLSSLGYRSLGLVYSSEMVFISKIIMDLAISSIVDSNLAEHSEENLRKVISTLDIGLIAMYLGLTMYPNGYKMRRPCLNNPKSCHHVEELLLKLENNILVDNSRFNEETRKFLGNPNTKHTVAEILDYQDKLTLNVPGKTVKLTDNLSVVMTGSGIGRYEESSVKWINSITKLIDSSAIQGITASQREAAIARNAQLTRARNYGHYISKIIIHYPNSEDTVIDDVETIETNMNDFASVNIPHPKHEEGEYTLADLIIDKVGEFIDNATVVITAIPRKQCPSCGVLQSDGYDLHPDVIVFDPVRTFFTLVGRKSELVNG